MLEINLQFFGGRGASSSLGGTGGASGSAKDALDLIKKNAKAIEEIEKKYNKEVASKRNEYIDKRFPDQNAKELSNNYWTMDRVSKDGDTVIVKVDKDTHIQDTKYGKALLLDQNHAVFLKDSDVSDNYYGTEVKLTKDKWNVKEWGDWEKKGLVGNDAKEHNFNTWKSLAKEQEKKGNSVYWEKTGAEKTVASLQKQSIKKKYDKQKEKYIEENRKAVNTLKEEGYKWDKESQSYKKS